MKRTWATVAATCLWPDFRWQSPYEIESPDGLDVTKGWLLEIEWLGFCFQAAGGRYRPKDGQT